jgi:hypothetical protein
MVSVHDNGGFRELVLTPRSTQWPVHGGALCGLNLTGVSEHALEMGRVCAPNVKKPTRARELTSLLRRLSLQITRSAFRGRAI